jgi:ATP-binding cassette, subfamily C (CFTR/MRP), member 1
MYQRQALCGRQKRQKLTIILQFLRFVAQEAWILNASIRDNILFGTPFDSKRYNRAVDASCLAPDFKILPAGDLTPIGDRGINLSGGQRQRVSIARALYADKDVYLFDDPLSAVDVHVGQAIFENAMIKMLKAAGKTVVLITNQLQYLPKADTIYMLKKGKIAEHGSFQELMENGRAFADLINEFGVFTDDEKKPEPAPIVVAKKSATDEKKESAVPAPAAALQGAHPSHNIN